MDAPVLAGGEVEACIGQTGRLGIAVDEREVVVVLVLERARRAELLGELSMPVGRPPPVAPGGPRQTLYSISAKTAFELTY